MIILVIDEKVLLKYFIGAISPITKYWPIKARRKKNEEKKKDLNGGETKTNKDSEKKKRISKGKKKL